jgi:hypothetical protein
LVKVILPFNYFKCANRKIIEKNTSGKQKWLTNESWEIAFEKQFFRRSKGRSRGGSSVADTRRLGTFAVVSTPIADSSNCVFAMSRREGPLRRSPFRENFLLVPLSTRLEAFRRLNDFTSAKKEIGTEN